MKNQSQENQFFKVFLPLGVLLEFLLLTYFFVTKDSFGDVFRFASRYSGRLSFIVYVVCFYFFSNSFKQGCDLDKTRKGVILFCVLHLIHFVFLALSVFLNQLPIIPFKLLGGFLAYFLIIAYPFVIYRIKKVLYHFLYFYYVGFVMAMTFMARIKGEFQGALPEPFHFIGLVTVVFVFILFGAKIYSHKKRAMKT